MVGLKVLNNTDFSVHYNESYGPSRIFRVRTNLQCASCHFRFVLFENQEDIHRTLQSRHGHLLQNQLICRLSVDNCFPHWNPIALSLPIYISQHSDRNDRMIGFTTKTAKTSAILSIEHQRQKQLKINKVRNQLIVRQQNRMRNCIETQNIHYLTGR